MEKKKVLTIKYIYYKALINKIIYFIYKKKQSLSCFWNKYIKLRNY